MHHGDQQKSLDAMNQIRHTAWLFCLGIDVKNLGCCLRTFTVVRSPINPVISTVKSEIFCMYLSVLSGLE